MFSYDLFPWQDLKATIVDTHFDKRDRMGRLMAFIARQIRDGISDSVLGIGIPEQTSIVVDGNGIAQVMGRGSAYFVLADNMPEICEPEKPLTSSNFKIWEVDNGKTFNLKNRPTTGYILRSVYQGKIS